jgi:hypothetical protein
MVDEELTSTSVPRPVGAASAGSPARSAWEFLEILAVVILAAESLRMLGSVISGVIYAATAHVGVFGDQQLVGSAMERMANFSDGPGIVLLLISLALLWWRAEYWTARINRTTGQGVRDGALPAEAIQAHRLRTLARWAMTLFVLAGVGAVAFLVGDILVNVAGGVPTSDQWQAYFSDSFSMAYFVIALAGVAASIKLTRLCDLDVARIDAPS